MTDAKPALSPCPFCGKQPYLDDMAYTGFVVVMCRNTRCFVEGPWRRTAAGAAAAWNRRAPVEQKKRKGKG